MTSPSLHSVHWRFFVFASRNDEEGREIVAMVDLEQSDTTPAWKKQLEWPKLLFPGVLLLTSLLVLFWRRRRRATNTCGAKVVMVGGIPGPRQYILGNYLNLLQLCYRQNIVTTLTEWCAATSGPIMRARVGPVEAVFLLSPHYIGKLLGSTKEEHLAKPSLLYGLIKPVEWFDGLVHSSGHKWKSRRRLLNPMFGHGRLLSYLSALNECGRRLVDGMDANFEKGERLSPHPIRSLLLDEILNTFLRGVLGIEVEKDSGCQEGNSPDLKTIVNYIKRTLEIATTRLVKPWLQVKLLFRLSPMFQEQRDIYNESLRQVMQVSEMTKITGNPGAGLSSSSVIADLRRGGLDNAEGIYEESLTLVAGAYETTGNGLHVTLFLLALHPSIQDKVRKEVDCAFDDPSLCSEDGSLLEGALPRLVTLKNCILESLRMVPPVPLFARQLRCPLVLDENLELPAGTMVAVWLPGLHMNPEYYPNPERFQPDRFSAKGKIGRQPYSYIPFSDGPRKCLGLKFAMMELLIATAHLVRNFIFSTPDRFEDVEWDYAITMAPATPFNFVFTRRN